MARITKAMLEADNAILRGDCRQLRTELQIVQEQATLYRDQYELLSEYIHTTTSTVASMSDAMAHTIGYITDPQRRRRQEPDLRTCADLHEADKRRGR